MKQFIFNLNDDDDDDDADDEYFSFYEKWTDGREREGLSDVIFITVINIWMFVLK